METQRAEMNVAEKAGDIQDDSADDQDDHLHRALVTKVNANIVAEKAKERAKDAKAVNKVAVAVDADVPEETTDHANQRVKVKVHPKVVHLTTTNTLLPQNHQLLKLRFQNLISFSIFCVFHYQ